MNIALFFFFTYFWHINHSVNCDTGVKQANGILHDIQFVWFTVLISAVTKIIHQKMRWRAVPRLLL